MTPPFRRSPLGYTHAELLLVLAILGILIAVAYPPIGRWRDRAAVHAARDELAAGLSRTRMLAVSAAGATLVLHPESGRFWTRSDLGLTIPPVDLNGRYHVHVDAAGGDSISFRYDALGIGRLASRTVWIRRRDAEAGLTVSAYGRLRRW